MSKPAHPLTVICPTLSSIHPAGALLERPELLILLSVGALLVSGGTLAALHLLLQPGAGKRRGARASAAAAEEQAAAALKAIAQYDLERSLEEELALVLSEPEPEEEAVQQPSAQGPQAGAAAGQNTPRDGRKLSWRARCRRKRKGALVGPHIEVCMYMAD